MKNLIKLNTKILRVSFMLFITLGLTVTFVACSDGLLNSVLNPDRDAQTNTGTTKPTDITPAPTPDPTPTQPRIAALTINELPKNTGGFRPYYVAFSVATKESGQSYKDYYLALKAADAPKPSANEIHLGTRWQRNLSNTPINIYGWAPVGTLNLENIGSEATARSRMLLPSTTYILWGMPSDGTDADVTEYKRFTTDQEPSVSTGNDSPVDKSLFNGPIFSMRVGENFQMDMPSQQTDINFYTHGFDIYSGPAGTTKPSVEIDGSNMDVQYDAKATPQSNVLTNILFFSRNSPADVMSFLIKIGSNEWWFKTTTDF